jgi:RNA polymerase sigma factor (sigma-70 family)
LSPRDLAKLEALYARYSDRVYQFCARLCENPADAEDLARDVLLIAFRDQQQYEGRGEFSSWLYSIASHRWERMRLERGPVALPLSDGMLDTSPYPGSAHGHLDRLSLDAAIRELPPSQRHALVLVKMQGLTYHEAAGTLGVTVGTVKSQVHDALGNLRLALREDEPQAGSGSQPDTRRATASRPPTPPREHLCREV